MTAHQKLLEVFKGNKDFLKNLERMLSITPEDQQNDFCKYLFTIYEAGRNSQRKKWCVRDSENVWHIPIVEVGNSYFHIEFETQCGVRVVIRSGERKNIDGRITLEQMCSACAAFI